MPLSVPVGYRFHPTEEELVNHYLKKKMQGNDSEINGIIPEIDVCKYEPTELPALSGTETETHDDMEWFFFTRKDYKYNNSARSNRCTKQGYWKITSKERGIKARRSKAVIGKKRTLTFYQGRVPKSKKTNWVIHEYYLPVTEIISYQKQAQGDFVICRLKNKSNKRILQSVMKGNRAQENCESLFHAPQLPLDDCCSALQSPTSPELEDVLQANGTNGDCNKLQSPFGDNGSCVSDKNEILTCDEDDTVYDMFLELCDQPERNLDSLFYPLQLQENPTSILQSPIYTKLGNVPHPLQPQGNQPPILQSPISTKLGNVLHQAQDYQPPILQSPIYTKLGNAPHANVYYGECNKWQSTFEKKNSTNEVDIPVRHIVSNFENQATYYRIQELRPQTQRNPESSFYPLQPQDYTLQPLMYTELGDALHNIECNELFGDNDSSITKFLNTSFADQDHYSSEETAQTTFKDSNLTNSLGRNYHWDSGVSNETNTEVVHGWLQYSSALAIGNTLQCS
ncbi:hypothetical protein M0R45_005442 [Rubus argutus]|uniref:NAC domain-containing protein n=1 Tax=Rubus argutus TaxID=59490 RepID=A0AAW1YMV8_RUBAR